MKPTLLALLLASACTTMRSKMEPPQITLESVRIVRIAEGKADLSASLRLANRNDFELAIDDTIEYYSREGAALARNEQLAPRLVLMGTMGIAS